MPRITNALGLALFGLAVAFSATALAQDKPAPKTHKVLIKGFKFEPEKLEVDLGDTVVWTNEDIVPHTATSAKNFDSKGLDKGKSWSLVTKKKGSLPYICTYHPTMTGQLVVK